MSDPRALLTAAVIGAMCACIPAGAAAAGTGRRSPASSTPVTRSAHTGHLPRHAHALCKSSRKGRRKHHGKPPARCHGQASRGNSHGAGHTRSRRAKPSSRTLTRSLQAKPTAHPSNRSKGDGGEKNITVTLGDPQARTIASVLATPCQNTELMPEAGNLDALEEATVCLINQERARNNEEPLQLNAQLAQTARSHSQDMVGEDYFAHVAPDGETPFTRVQRTGYIPNSQVGYTLGENIAWGTLSMATPNSIVAAWIASPEHLANILNSAYRDTAVGVAPAAPPSLAEGQPGGIYTQEFGVIED